MFNKLRCRIAWYILPAAERVRVVYSINFVSALFESFSESAASKTTLEEKIELNALKEKIQARMELMDLDNNDLN